MYMGKSKVVVILGAGFGGLACANALQRGLAKMGGNKGDEDKVDSSHHHRIIVIDKKKSFTMGLVNLWILAGTRRPDESQTPLDGLNKRRGIEYLNDEVTKIDTPLKRVNTREHGWISYDYLVVALGSELAPERIEGFVGRGYNLYDSDQIQPLRDRLLSLRQGNVAVSIMGMPYKCPPAPYEAAMIINDILGKNGTRQKVRVDLYVPAPIALPVVGPKVSHDIVDMIAGYNIGFHPNCKPRAVRDGEIEFESGEKAKYDVLVGIPPHRSPDVIKSSGLLAKAPETPTPPTSPSSSSSKTAAPPTAAGGGAMEWVPVDRLTLRTGHPDVFAIGDVADVRSGSVTVPKAGIFAEGQANVVAQQILYDITVGKREEKEKSEDLQSSKVQSSLNNNNNLSSYDGQGFCFVEVGNNMAGLVEVDFYHPDGPSVKLQPPSPQSYEKKHEFERSRIKEWLL
jgi:sulfide:quinone oxidoreductase